MHAIYSPQKHTFMIRNRRENFKMTPQTTRRRLHRILILIVECLSVVVSVEAYYQSASTGYLFTIPDASDGESRSQQNAQYWCSQNGSILLEIINADVQKAVVQFINDAIWRNQMTGNTVVTNGKIGSSSWTWLNEYQSVTQNLQITDQSGGLGYSYVFLNTTPSGFIASADIPTKTRHFICEDQQGDCTGGFQWNGRCYKSFTNEMLSWYDARDRCLGNGGDLASFEWIQNFTVLNGSWLTLSDSYWIGLRRQNWFWQNSKLDVKYSLWSSDHPVYDVNKECLCLAPNYPYYDWKWTECDCRQTYKFVCIAVPPSPFTSSTTLSTSSTSTRITPSTSTTESYVPGAEGTASHSRNVTEINPTSPLSVLTTKEVEHSDNRLAIGLGVGLGGGFLIAIIIIAVALVLKFNIHRRFSRKTIPPDVTLTGVEGTHYAVIQRKNPPLDDDSTPTYNTIPSGSSAEYAPITIQGAKTATIGPPSLPKSTAAADHSAMYAEVNK